MNWPDYPIDNRPDTLFLDVDGTLHPGTTAYLVALEMKRRGLVKGSFFRRAIWFGLQHRFGRLNYEQLIDDALKMIQHVPVIDLERMSYECFARDVKPNLFPNLESHLDSLRKTGSRLVLVSSSLRHSLEPLRIYLGAEEIISTPIIERRGFLTSRGPGPACYGPGKLHWAQQWCELNQVDIKKCAAYGDNYSDHHLMQATGWPVAVRPSRNLRRHAIHQGWQIVD